MKKEEKERLEKRIAEHREPKEENPGIDYAEEYKEQTGKELSDGVKSKGYDWYMIMGN